MNKVQKALSNPDKIFPYLKQRYRVKIDEPYIQSVDRKIGNAVLGMPVEYQKHLFGELAIKKSRIRSDYTTNTLGSKAEFLRKNEYVDLGQPYDVDLIGKIRDRFNEIMEADEYTRVRGEAEGKTYAKGVEHDKLLELIPEIPELVNNDVKEIVSQYYGTHFQVLRASFYRINHVPADVVENTEVYNNYWHVDGRTTDHLKLFVLFSDTTEADGPMHLLSRDDTRDVVAKNNGFDRQNDGVPGSFVREHAENVKLFTGEPGTAMIGNTQRILHRAGNPEPGRQRDMILFYLAPAVKELPDNWHEKGFRTPSTGRLTRLLRY